MLHLLHYWYLNSPTRFLAGFLQTIRGLEANFAVVDTFKNIGKPLFQDYTRGGRAIGFLIRLARIGGGIFIYFLVALAYALIYAIWLAFPFICIANILGAIFAAPPDSQLYLPIE